MYPIKILLNNKESMSLQIQYISPHFWASFFASITICINTIGMPNEAAITIDFIRVF